MGEIIRVYKELIVAVKNEWQSSLIKHFGVIIEEL
jgi:hypothetical protein